VSDFEELVGIT